MIQGFVLYTKQFSKDHHNNPKRRGYAMHRNRIAVLLLLFFSASTRAERLPTVELRPGTNEIRIKLDNKWNIALESVYVELKPESLPEGISVSPTPSRLDVSAKSKSEQGLILRIEVDDRAGEGVYEIPFTLKDKANHSWSFVLNAHLAARIPVKYDLAQNHPNPFNAGTTISYSLANRQEQKTQLAIYDLWGRQMRMLVSKMQVGGVYEETWDGSDEMGVPVASGIYFYRLTSGSFEKTSRMLLLK